MCYVVYVIIIIIICFIDVLTCTWNSLSNNNLGEAEAEALIVVIKDNHSIATLILDDNSFADRGAKHIGTMLTRAKQLEQLRYLINWMLWL